MDMNNLFQKIQRLVKEHESLKKENEKLKVDITTSQREKLELEIRFSALETQIAAKQTMGQGMDEKEKEEMTKRINRYIKEIDKAITLLNG
jgi:regulator of replication initiation timing